MRRFKKAKEKMMTVGELIEELQEYDEENEVMFGYNYGDRSQTTVFQKVSKIRNTEVEYSKYFQLHTEVDEEEIETGIPVVILT